MKKSIQSTFFVFVLLTVLLSGCAPASTPVSPTLTPAPPTNTPIPTATPTKPPTSTPTPDVVATQKAEELSALLKPFIEKGYLDSTNGEVSKLDFSEGSWQNDVWNHNTELTDFLFKAHYDWTGAKVNSQVGIGCRIIFGMSPPSRATYFELYFSTTKINLSWNKSQSPSPLLVHPIGKTSGKGSVNFGDKTETDFVFLVRGQSVYVLVDGEITEYTIEADRSTKGYFILGRNIIGTTCKMTDIMIWTPK